MSQKLKLNLIIKVLIVVIVIFAANFNQAYAIKIGLLTNTQYAYIATSKYGAIIDGYTGNKLVDISPMQPYGIKSNGQDISLVSKYETLKLNSRYLILETEPGGFVCTKNKWYRNKLVIYNLGSGLTVINDINLEDYLLGVVPSEMPRSWNIEAHKAQAIAARSYAVANLGKRARFGYDLKDTPEDQAYGGVSSESSRTTNAVTQTKGQVLVYENKVIPAYYHSSSGGYTVNSGSVWMRDLPFIKSVPSFDGNLPKRGHGIGMSQHGANVLANYGYNAYQILGYFYQNVQLYRLDNIL